MGSRNAVFDISVQTHFQRKTLIAITSRVKNHRIIDDQIFPYFQVPRSIIIRHLYRTVGSQIATHRKSSADSSATTTLGSGALPCQINAASYIQIPCNHVTGSPHRCVPFSANEDIPVYINICAAHKIAFHIHGPHIGGGIELRRSRHK